MQGPEENSYKEFGNEKKFLQVENSPPPHNFSNGPSLTLPYAKIMELTLRKKLLGNDKTNTFLSNKYISQAIIQNVTDTKSEL